MAGGYTTPPTDALDDLRKQLRHILTRLSPLESATGTQKAELLRTVIEKIAQIDQLVHDAITTHSYTRPQIDARIAHPGHIAATGHITTAGDLTAAGDITTGGNIATGGSLTATQNVTAAGTGDFAGGLRSVGAYHTRVTGGGSYSAAWLHSDGRLGQAPSSERFKQDIHPTTLDPTTLLNAEVVTFRYKEAVENLADNAPTVLGCIAEQFHDNNLGFAVSYDENGDPFSIEDRPLLYALLHTFQHHTREQQQTITDLTTRLEHLEQTQNPPPH